jgi:hypothetical protein
MFKDAKFKRKRRRFAYHTNHNTNDVNKWSWIEALLETQLKNIENIHYGVSLHLTLSILENCLTMKPST